MHSLIVDAGACYRLTRLVTDDTIVRPLREAVIALAYERQGVVESDLPANTSWTEAVLNDPDPPRLAELVTCRWCAGMWVSLGIVFVARRFRWWPRMAQALALSAGAALLARLED